MIADTWHLICGEVRRELVAASSRVEALEAATLRWWATLQDGRQQGGPRPVRGNKVHTGCDWLDEAALPWQTAWAWLPGHRLSVGRRPPAISRSVQVGDD